MDLSHVESLTWWHSFLAVALPTGIWLLAWFAVGRLPGRRR
jgi:hypothetical protein